MRALIALALLALASPAAAQGLFPGLPEATEITPEMRIPADTGIAQGAGPSTVLISPQLLQTEFGSGPGDFRSLYVCADPGIAFGSVHPVVTETYVGEVAVPWAGTLNGIAILNGPDVHGHGFFGLANSSGQVLATTALGGTVLATAFAYQRVPLTAPVQLVPGNYFIMAQFDDPTHGYVTVGGNCNKNTLAGTTFGTLSNFTAPTTAVTLGGIAAGLY